VEPRNHARPAEAAGIALGEASIADGNRKNLTSKILHT
jgi:hypothetical protein